MTEIVEKDIVVLGSKPKPNVEVANTGDSGSLIPQNLAAVDWETGTGGLESPQRVRMFDRDGNKVFRFEKWGIEILIPEADWNAMTERQQRTLTYVFQNIERSDRLEAALAHYAREGVSEIVLRFGPSGWLHDGSARPFDVVNGQPVLGQVSYDHEPSDPTRTDIKAGSRIVISINSNNPAALNPDHFADAVIHELLHPWVPDIGGNDHDRVVPWSAEERDDIFGGGSAFDLPAGAEQGVAYIGSRHADSDVGTSGGDVMAGMEGNDVLNGISGNDILSGGLGMDRLVAGSGFSDLRGGLDADTYVASALDANFVLTDTGGVDRLVIAGSSGDFLAARTGDNLLIWSNAQGFGYEVVGHYLDGRRIEVFEFNDAQFSASYIEYLAANTPGPGVCYDGGNPVLCGNYGMPVVIDLDGDGAELVEANKSRVRWDVDGDGKAERVGWTNGDDAFLVLDRNANGIIDSFAELSFLSDFRGAGSDLEGLLAYDDNRDGFLTADDSIFAKLQLWRDEKATGSVRPANSRRSPRPGFCPSGSKSRD